MRELVQPLPGTFRIAAPELDGVRHAFFAFQESRDVDGMWRCAYV